MIITQRDHPSLAIDQHLLIRFPYAHYAYVSKSAPRLAERIRYGLEEMRKDGSFDRLFQQHFAQAFVDLRWGQRTVIELENPSLPAWAKIPPLE
jgi:membrane-bound lytic murein transglycosylase MltF